MLSWRLQRRKPRHHERISLLVPFRSDKAERERNWKWLERYWLDVMPPGTEVIMGENEDTPFCKTNAVNAAFRRARGDVIVILDADCYIDPNTILDCARQIREARNKGLPLWFLPYRRFYRLTKAATYELLQSDPLVPMTFNDPPKEWQYVPHHNPSSGHWWGALIQIMPREAFELVGGMDEKFRGWGGEDVSFMRALDTLYGKHRTFNGPVYHLWHPTIPGLWKGTRQWEGQDSPEMNDWLAYRYEQAIGDPKKMREVLK